MSDVIESEPGKTVRAASERELVARAQAGDAAAFEELVRRHEGKVRRLAQYLCHGHAQDGEETAQNALLKAYLHLAAFRGESQFCTWLARIAVNECRMHLRTQRRAPRSQSLDNELGEEGNISLELVHASDDPEEQCCREEFQAILQRALRAMGEKYRLAFVLSKIEGLTNKELAARLGVSVPTAKTRLLRARRRLQRNLAETFCRQGHCYWPGAGPSNGRRFRASMGGRGPSESR